MIASLNSVVLGSIASIAVTTLFGTNVITSIAGVCIKLVIYFVVLKLVFQAPIGKILIIWLILAAFPAVLVYGFIQKGQISAVPTREEAAKADIASLKTALTLYELDNGSYPTTEEGLAALLSKPASCAHWNGPYLKTKPLDPWRREYRYQSPGRNNADYTLFSLGKDGKESKDDVTAE